MGYRKLTTEQFIENAKIKHGDTYDYSRVNYINSKTKVEILCKTHGPFLQLPTDHYRFGCKKCGFKKSGESSSMSTGEFIQKAKEIHGDRYDYSKTIYKRLKSKIVVTCKVHGDFKTTPFNHIHNKSNCSKCRDDSIRMGIKSFIDKSNKIHFNKYDYSKSEYKNNRTKITIICPTHGEFKQIPYHHLNGSGCPSCGAKKASDARILTTEQFIERAKFRHGDKYDYSKTKYIHSSENIGIGCKTHGIFYQNPSLHLYGQGCPKCVSHHSKLHVYVKDYFEGKARMEDCSKGLLFGNLEIDLFFPDFNLGIEFNGAYFHSEKFKDKFYHQNKFIYAKEKGITLLQFWDTDKTNKDLIISMIKAKLGMNKRVFARKTTAEKIPFQLYSDFISKNHIQGVVYSKYTYGLFFEGRLISVIGFGERQGEIFLDRFASIQGITVVGGFSKLLKFANFNKPIVTFSDSMYSSGEVYRKNGFKAVKENSPRLYFTNGSIIKNRRNFQKSQIKKNYPDVYDESLTEKEMAEKLGFFRLWGTGTTKWVYDNENLKK